jgi:glucokinase
MIQAPTAVHSEHDLAVGIDIGGTKAATVVTDGDDCLLLHEIVPTEPGRLVEQVVALARRAQQRFEAEGRSVVAVGVAVPGHVDAQNGTLRMAVNLGLPDVSLGSLVAQALDLPCAVEHDARAAARWLHARAGNGRSHLAYLSIGTGISAGVVTDGRPLHGATGLAGEVGHVVAQPDGLRCACGLAGCLETVAAGPAIARLAREAVDAGRETVLPRQSSPAAVFIAAASGDAVACEIAQAVATHLARAVRALVLAFGVERVVIGGGVAAAGDALLAPLLAALERERLASPLIESAFAKVRIELLSPQVEAGARGAAAIARQRIGAQQREEVGDA